MAKFFLIVLLIVAAWWMVTRFRERPRVDTGRPVPVQDLPQGVRESIDHLLANGRTVQAIKVYRDATRASLLQAKQAIDERHWKRR